MELKAGPQGLGVEEGHRVGILGGHAVWPDILHVGNHQVARHLGPAHVAGVQILDQEPEHVAVPFEDKVPKVALAELLCPVEEDAVGPDGDRVDVVVRLEVGHHHGQAALEGALAVERAL